MELIVLQDYYDAIVIVARGDNITVGGEDPPNNTPRTPRTAFPRTAWHKANFICRLIISKFEKSANYMTTTAIRKKLTDYLKIADDKKVKAIYTMVEDEITTAENNWDNNFIKELVQKYF